MGLEAKNLVAVGEEEEKVTGVWLAQEVEERQLVKRRRRKRHLNVKNLQEKKPK